MVPPDIPIEVDFFFQTHYFDVYGVKIYTHGIHGIGLYVAT